MAIEALEKKCNLFMFDLFIKQEVEVMTKTFIITYTVES